MKLLDSLVPFSRKQAVRHRIVCGCQQCFIYIWGCIVVHPINTDFDIHRLEEERAIVLVPVLSGHGCANIIHRYDRQEVSLPLSFEWFQIYSYQSLREYIVVLHCMHTCENRPQIYRNLTY